MNNENFKLQISADGVVRAPRAMKTSNFKFQTSNFTLYIAAVVLLLVSCSDDDTSVPDSSQDITIVSNNLIFEPTGGTGTLSVTTVSGSVQAELNATWCQATVNGSTITVTAEENPSFEGRTTLLTLRSGEASRQVPVQQRGMALGSLPVHAHRAPIQGERYTIYIRHDLPIQLTTDEEWLHPYMNGDTLVVEVAPHTDRFIRRGAIRFECAGYTDELLITQYNLEASILGCWYMGGNMGGAATGFRFNVVKQGEKYYHNFFTMTDWADQFLDLEFDEDRCEIIFHSMTSIYTDPRTGSNDTYYFFTTEGLIAASHNATMRASIFYNPLWGSHYAVLEDTGSWGGGTLYGFLIRTTNSFYATNLVQLTDPYLVWLGPEGTNLNEN